MSLLVLAIAAAIAPLTPVGSKSTPEAMQGLQAYGRCLASERPEKVRALLDSDFRDPTYPSKLQKLMDNRPACPGVPLPSGTFATGGLALNGALAEGLLRRDKALGDLDSRTAFRPDLPMIAARNSGEVMAYCVVRENAAGVAGFLNSEPGTQSELDALKALGPTVSNCLPAKTQANFTRESLRALIAVGAYRLAAHNSQEAAE